MPFAEFNPETGLPTRLARFRLVKPLASGGMARLFIGDDPKGTTPLERRVVVKLIHEHLASQDAFVRMFVDEAHLCMAMNHRNVVKVKELHQEGSRIFMVLEYVDGTDLARMLGALRKMGQHLDPALAAYVAYCLLRGLNHAHNAKDEAGHLLAVVHRDVSPSNVLISRAGEVKVADFGVAKAMGRMTHSAPGELKGKFCYMPPELVSNGTCDQRGDIFGVGVVLWESLAGRRLFDGANEVQAMGAVLKQPVEAPASFRPDVTHPLSAIVMKALERRPERRFQTAQEMSEALAGFLGKAPRGMFARAIGNLVERSLAPPPVLNPIRTPAPIELPNITPVPPTPAQNFAAARSRTPAHVPLTQAVAPAGPDLDVSFTPVPGGESARQAAATAVLQTTPLPLRDSQPSQFPVPANKTLTNLPAVVPPGPRNKPSVDDSQPFDLTVEEVMDAFGRTTGSRTIRSDIPNAVRIQVLGAVGLNVGGELGAEHFWKVVRKPALPKDLKVMVPGDDAISLEEAGPLLGVDHLVTPVPEGATLTLQGTTEGSRLLKVAQGLDSRGARGALVLDGDGEDYPVTLFFVEGGLHYVHSFTAPNVLDRLLEGETIMPAALDLVIRKILSRRLNLLEALLGSGAVRPAVLRASVEARNRAILEAARDHAPTSFKVYLDVLCPVAVPPGGERLADVLTQLFGPR